MKNHVELRPGAYADSVTLLQVSRTVQETPGVAAAQVAMATVLNVEVLEEMGFDVPKDATPNDLVVALRIEDDAALDAGLAAVGAALAATTRRDTGTAEVAPPRTTAAALGYVGLGHVGPGRTGPGDAGDAGEVVLVSVPGASALVEAMDALDAGRDVMVFSDNVPLNQEVTLKKTAHDRGLLVMGPDCGTAVVGGLGLGFANATSPGPVGIVAASGTGCQQVLALLDHGGVGVGSALGVGGRDLSTEVRGLSTREAMRRLDADDAVELILVISKPPADDVAAEIREYAISLTTPVEFALLGPGQPDLTAATEAVLRRLGRTVPTWPVVGHADPSLISDGSALRGLFVGGTLASEARIVATELLGEGGGHTFVDFGDDAYTEGRAHPMIDPTLRLEHLARAAADPETGVILLDVVLGHGAEPDPGALLAPAIAGVERPVVIAVVGTAHDPQDLDRQVRVLAEAGAEVHLSNAAATRRAAELLGARA
jgi:FdrA protein